MNLTFGKFTRSSVRFLKRMVIMLPLFTLLAGGVASAQTVPDLDQIKSAEVLAGLSDSQLRELLLQRLEDTKSSSIEDAGFDPSAGVEKLQQNIGKVQTRFVEMLGVRHRIGDELTSLWGLISGKSSGGSVIPLILITLAAFLLGWSAEKYALRLFKSPRQTLVIHQNEAAVVPLSTRLVRLGGLLGLRLLGIFMFAVVAAICFFVLSSGGGDQRTTFFYYLAALLLVRLASAFIDVFYATNFPSLRLPLYDDRQAQGIRRGLVITIGLSAFGFFTCALIATFGLRSDAHPLLLMMVGNMYVGALAITIYLYRHAVIHDIRAQSAEKSLRYVMAPAWPWVVIVTTVFIWLAVVFTALSGGLPLYGAAIFTTWVMLFYPTVDASMEREANRAIDNNEEVLVAVMRVVRFVSCIVMFILLTSAWGVELYSLADAGIGAKLTAIGLQIFLVLLVAYVIWQFTRIWIDRKVAIEDAIHAEEAGGDLGEMEIGGAGLSRLRTLLPLLKMVIRVALGSIVMMLILSSLGINIVPVLAGAGVIGLAIGFGSQTLVRDVVSGGFFLIDDAFRLGEYVDVGEVKGVVEKIQIRSLRLRHHLGAVHTVPFGEIVRLTNFSRDWTIMKLKFRVPFDTDIEKLRKVIKKVGQDMLNHPEVGEDFIQPLKSQGVLETDDYGLVVRVKFMAKPGGQFLIRRYAFMALQQAFVDNGIEFAKPEIRVVSGDEEELSDIGTKGSAALAASEIGKTNPQPALT